MIPRPANGKTPLQTEGPIVLQLQHSNPDPPSISINRQHVMWNELTSRLGQIYRSRADHVLFIKGDSEVEFESVARVIDAAHSADVQRVGLIP